jgi:hypothetical protein
MVTAAGGGSGPQEEGGGGRKEVVQGFDFVGLDKTSAELSLMLHLHAATTQFCSHFIPVSWLNAFIEFYFSLASTPVTQTNTLIKLGWRE